MNVDTIAQLEEFEWFVVKHLHLLLGLRHKKGLCKFIAKAADKSRVA